MEKMLLTPALVDDLIFALEDQGDRQVLDLDQGRLVDGTPDGSRFLPLPRWTGREGFQLMTDFVQHLRSPLARTDLQKILDRGEGVFKAFKHRLKEEPVLYRQWLHFKRSRMEEVIWTWAQEWNQKMTVDRREEGDPEVLMDLLLEDFALRPATPADWEVLPELDRAALEEEAREAGSSSPDWYRALRRRHVSYGDRDQGLLVAETPSGEIGGLVWGQLWIDESLGPFYEVLLWWTAPEFRGLGLGRLLLQEASASAFRQGAVRILQPTPRTSGVWKEVLKNLGWIQEGEVWGWEKK